MTDIGCDIVLPYVDSNDPYWLSDYIKATGEYSPSPCRFRSWGTLKYLFRAIATNIPFVKNIIFIASRESQIPDWLNHDNVHVVFHNEFIPAQFAPAFNSCTIEGFLYNISGISEQFLYFNDDLFPIHNIKYTDFFTDNLPNLDFIRITASRHTLFTAQCRSGLDLITSALGIPKYPDGRLFVPEHSVTPMLYSDVLTVGGLCKAKISDTITPLRSPKNINQYIYSYYAYLTQHYVPTVCPYGYINLDDNITPIQAALDDPRIKVLCLNDKGDTKHYGDTSRQLIQLLDAYYPDKCKYEI